MDKIVFNNSCFFGINSINEIGKEIQNRHFKKGFVITDNGLVEAGIFQKVTNVLVRNKIPSVMFSDVTPDPSIRDVKNAYSQFKRSNADFILAIGGGSPIDTAKAISVIATNPKYEDVVSLQGHKDDLNPPIPIFAVPTTAGSASEISKSFVLTDELTSKKIVCFNDKMLPVETFIDADLMTTIPDIITLSSGFDALTHAVESLLSKKANMFSTTLSKEAIKIIVEYLPKSYDNPDDIEAREHMAYAEYIAGLAYSNSGLGICHSMAHAISGKFRVQHGIALSMLLPSVLKFNMFSSAASKYKFIAEAFDVQTNGMTQDEICRATVKEMEKFKNDFNIPKKLSDYGIHEEDLDILSVNAFEDACTSSNPREVTMTDIYSIFRKLL
jgi:lactaldehyde reductase